MIFISSLQLQQVYATNQFTISKIDSKLAPFLLYNKSPHCIRYRTEPQRSFRCTLRSTFDEWLPITIIPENFPRRILFGLSRAVPKLIEMFNPLISSRPQTKLPFSWPKRVPSTIRSYHSSGHFGKNCLHSRIFMYVLYEELPGMPGSKKRAKDLMIGFS